MKRFALALILCLLPAAVFAGDYVVGEGDGLDISVWGVKELSFTVRVRPDGKITVPGIGDVKATAMTPTQLQASLSDQLKDLVKNPIVTVTVSDIKNSKVFIFGDGVKSGVIDLTRRTTLLQLLCSIGELKSADLKSAYLLRKGKKIKENFYSLFVDGDLSGDIDIESDDALFFPLLQNNEVYIVGAVVRPLSVQWRDGIKVLDVILAAGSFTKYASENSTVILRKEGGKEITIPVRAKDLIEGGDMRQNVNLKAGDYIVVKEGMF